MLGIIGLHNIIVQQVRRAKRNLASFSLWKRRFSRIISSFARLSVYFQSFSIVVKLLEEIGSDVIINMVHIIIIINIITININNIVILIIPTMLLS